MPRAGNIDPALKTATDLRRSAFSSSRRNMYNSTRCMSFSGKSNIWGSYTEFEVFGLCTSVGGNEFLSSVLISKLEHIYVTVSTNTKVHFTVTNHTQVIK